MMKKKNTEKRRPRTVAQEVEQKAPVEEPQPHVEIKARAKIDGTLAKKLVEKGSVIGVVATGKISGPAKKILDEANIAWAENVEKKLQEKEAAEEG